MKKSTAKKTQTITPAKNSSKDSCDQKTKNHNVDSASDSPLKLPSTLEALSSFEALLENFKAQCKSEHDERSAFIKNEVRKAVAENQASSENSSASNNSKQGENNSSFSDSMLQLVEREIKKLDQEWELKWTALIKKLEALSTAIAETQDQADNLEAYIRRPCLLFHGLPQTPNEDLLTIIPRFVSEKLNINITSKDILAVHRLPLHKKGRSRDSTSASSGSSSSSVAPIIVKFLYMRDRYNIFFNKKKLKGSKFSISENLTKKRSELLKTVRNHDLVSWTFNGSIFVLDNNNRRKKITCVEDIKKFSNVLQKFKKG